MILESFVVARVATLLSGLCLLSVMVVPASQLKYWNEAVQAEMSAKHSRHATWMLKEDGGKEKNSWVSSA